MYERGAGVARERFPARLHSILKACNIGEARGCLNLSIMYANGKVASQRMIRKQLRSPQRRVMEVKLSVALISAMAMKTDGECNGIIHVQKFCIPRLAKEGSQLDAAISASYMTTVKG